MEQWRPIPGLEGRYEISDLGRVRHAITGHIRKPYQRQGLAYQLVSYRQGPASRSFYVHRAVLEAFKPRTESANLECHHLNFNPADNRLDNLMWVTKAQNLQLTWQAGRQENGKRLRTERQREWYRARAANPPHQQRRATIADGPIRRPKPATSHMHRPAKPPA